MLPKFLRRKPEEPVEVEEGVTPPAELLLTDKAPEEPKQEAAKPKAEKRVERFEIRVPAGHVLPKGNKVTASFPLVVEVGVRWHPDWDGPRITANGYQFFPHGDCLVWSGDKLAENFGSLLPADVNMLVPYHGQPYPADGKSEADLTARVAIKSMGVTPPTEAEKIADFILPEQVSRH